MPQEAYRGSRDTAPLILNLSARWGGWSKPFYPLQRTPYPLQRRMGGSQSRFGWRKSLVHIANWSPDPPAGNKQPTTLSRPLWQLQIMSINGAGRLTYLHVGDFVLFLRAGGILLGVEPWPYIDTCLHTETQLPRGSGPHPVPKNPLWSVGSDLTTNVPPSRIELNVSLCSVLRWLTATEHVTCPDKYSEMWCCVVW
jgi:hypothetical protein